MFSQLLPAWFKNVVYAVNREMRRPIITLLTDQVAGEDLIARSELTASAASAAAAGSDLKQNAVSKVEKDSKDLKDSKTAVVSSSASTDASSGSESTEAKLQRLVEARVAVWCENALFLLQDFELLTRSSSGGASGGVTASPAASTPRARGHESPFASRVCFPLVCCVSALTV